MNTYWVWVRLSESTGSGMTKAYINADNVFSAYAMARSMYGKLLFSGYAQPVM